MCSCAVFGCGRTAHASLYLQTRLEIGLKLSNSLLSATTASTLCSLLLSPHTPVETTSKVREVKDRQSLLRACWANKEGTTPSPSKPLSAISRPVLLHPNEACRTSPPRRAIMCNRSRCSHVEYFHPSVPLCHKLGLPAQWRVQGVDGEVHLRRRLGRRAVPLPRSAADPFGQWSPRPGPLELGRKRAAERDGRELAHVRRRERERDREIHTRMCHLCVGVKL